MHSYIKLPLYSLYFSTVGKDGKQLQRLLINVVRIFGALRLFSE